jgi:asparagine synthetase B (glutamine-hydrolysing)
MGSEHAREGGVVFRRFDDDGLAINIATNEVFQLSETAAAIFELARKGRNQLEIVAALSAAFADTPANLGEQVASTVAELVRSGLLAPSRSVVAATSDGVRVLPSRWRARFSPDGPGLTFAASEDCDADVFEDGRCQVAVVGRLTNEDELGLPPTSRSRAAIVAAAFHRFGGEFIHHVKGPSAIALFDRRTRNAYAVRDRVGREPVYFTSAGDGSLVLSDAISTLLAEPGVSRALDPLVLAAFSCDLGPDPEETCFRSVRRLPPGHLLRWTGGCQRIERYWRLELGDLHVHASTDDVYQEFVSRFRAAVIRETTPSAGLYLSGGLDSISVALAAHMPPERRVRVALALSFPDPAHEETRAQRAVASALGIELVLRSFDECLGGRTLVDAALDWTVQMDAPLQNIFRPVFAALDDEAKPRGVTRILAGFGGDEWLGVTPYWMADLLARGHLGQALHFAGEYGRTYAVRSGLDTARMAWSFGVRPLLIKGLQRLAERTTGDAASPNRLRARRGLPRWLAPDPNVREALVERIAMRSVRSGSDYEREVTRTLDHPIVMLEHEESAQVARLTKLGRGAPFWDEDLVAFLARVPPNQLSSDRGKALARRFVQEHLAQPEIVNQRKYVDQRHFLRSLGQQVARPLGGFGFGRTLQQIGVVDTDRMKAVWEKCEQSPELAIRLWSVVNTEAWLRAHV